MYNIFIKTHPTVVWRFAASFLLGQKPEGCRSNTSASKKKEEWTQHFYEQQLTIKVKKNGALQTWILLIQQHFESMIYFY